MQDEEFDALKKSLTQFARICELVSKAGEDPFKQEIERHFTLANIDSTEKLDNMIRCVNHFEMICKLFDDAGVDTSDSEFIDDDVYIVHIDTKIWDLPCYISLELPEGTAQLNFGIIDSDGVHEATININDDQDEWVLHAHCKKNQPTLLLPLLDELGLVDGEVRTFSGSDLEKIICTFGRFVLKVRELDHERHVDNDPL
jgi:hypothetical protein